jgi:hypothetical protein
MCYIRWSCNTLCSLLVSHSYIHLESNNENILLRLGHSETPKKHKPSFYRSFIGEVPMV